MCTDMAHPLEVADNPAVKELILLENKYSSTIFLLKIRTLWSNFSQGRIRKLCISSFRSQ